MSRLAAIWCYPWDLLAEGLDVSLSRIADAGLTALSLAVSYHAGMCLLPHNPRQKVRFLEDGALYFRPPVSCKERMTFTGRFQCLTIQPRLSDLVGAEDPLEAIGAAARQHGLEVVAWTVCCHNTYQGERHLDLTLENAFGDRYPFALCPSQPDVQSYLQALVQELSAYPLRAIQLESYDFMGFRHGHHHEKVQLELGPLTAYLLGLCFCPACRRAAAEANADPEAARQATRRYLEAAFEGEVQEPTSFSEEAVVAAVPVLGPYLTMRAQVVARLAARLAHASIVPLALLGAAQPTLEAVGARLGEITECVYRVAPDEVAQGTRAARAFYGAERRVTIGLEATPRFSPTAQNLVDKVQAAWGAGADGLYFYNYGLLPLRSLAWLRQALHR